MFDAIKALFTKGIFTSEFWLGVVASLWVVLKTSFDPARSWREQVGILAPLAGSAVWAFVRTWLKIHRTTLAREVVNAEAIQAANAVPFHFEEEPLNIQFGPDGPFVDPPQDPAP